MEALKKASFFCLVYKRPTQTMHWASSSHLYSECDDEAGTSIEGRAEAVLGWLGAAGAGITTPFMPTQSLGLASEMPVRPCCPWA